MRARREFTVTLGAEAWATHFQAAKDINIHERRGDGEWGVHCSEPTHTVEEMARRYRHVSKSDFKDEISRYCMT